MTLTGSKLHIYIFGRHPDAKSHLHFARAHNSRNTEALYMDSLIVQAHSPFRTHLSLVEHTPSSSRQRLNELFLRAESRIEKIRSINDDYVEFKRPDEQLASNKSIVFEYLNENAQRIKTELFKLSLNDRGAFTKNILEKANDIAAEKNAISAPSVFVIPGSVDVILFDDTVGLFTFAVQVDFQQQHEVSTINHYLQEITNRFSEFMIDELYRKIVLPTLRIIESSQRKDSLLISPIGKHFGFPDIRDSMRQADFYHRTMACGIPLWTSRTVIIEQPEARSTDFANNWVVSRNQDVLDLEFMFERNQADKNRVRLGWGHNLVVAKFDSSLRKDAMDAMAYAQYYYSLFDVLSRNLTYSIALSRNIKKIRTTRKMRQTLDELVMTFGIIKTEYHDLFFDLQATRAYYLKDVMAKWGIGELLENIESKINACNNIINRNYQKSVKRSQRIAETLLLVISSVAILDYVKGLSEFEWAWSSGRRMTWPGILDLGRYDPNLMQWAGIGLLVVLTIIYARSLKNRS